MKIVRHCRERLPGGAAKWRRLARAAGFTGTLHVYGYGTGPRDTAYGHRKACTSEELIPVNVGYYTPTSHIQVWVDSPCGITLRPTKKPLETFSHELGHHLDYQNNRGWVGDVELKATRIGNTLLKEIE